MNHEAGAPTPPDASPGGLRLNLGCGARRLPDFVNVDRFGRPDLCHDLEEFPWPWADNSVAEVLFSHVLEHLGHDPKVFLGIMRELYRVCRDGALVRVVTPHHRHDYFYSDPTHVRPITPLGLSLFSQRLNREWQAQGLANSLLGLQYDVDFELVATQYKPGAAWRRLYPGSTDADRLLAEAELHDNLIEEVSMTLRAVKARPQNGAR